MTTENDLPLARPEGWKKVTQFEEESEVRDLGTIFSKEPTDPDYNFAPQVTPVVSGPKVSYVPGYVDSSISLITEEIVLPPEKVSSASVVKVPSQKSNEPQKPVTNPKT